MVAQFAVLRFQHGEFRWTLAMALADLLLRSQKERLQRGGRFHRANHQAEFQVNPSRLDRSPRTGHSRRSDGHYQWALGETAAERDALKDFVIVQTSRRRIACLLSVICTARSAPVTLTGLMPCVAARLFRAALGRGTNHDATDLNLHKWQRHQQCDLGNPLNLASVTATASVNCWLQDENSRQGLGQAAISHLPYGSAMYSQPLECIFQIGQVGSRSRCILYGRILSQWDPLSTSQRTLSNDCTYPGACG